jgi:hypothetical protein
MRRTRNCLALGLQASAKRSCGSHDAQGAAKAEIARLTCCQNLGCRRGESTFDTRVLEWSICAGRGELNRLCGGRRMERFERRWSNQVSRRGFERRHHKRHGGRPWILRDFPNDGRRWTVGAFVTFMLCHAPGAAAKRWGRYFRLQSHTEAESCRIRQGPDSRRSCGGACGCAARSAGKRRSSAAGFR